MSTITLTDMVGASANSQIRDDSPLAKAKLNQLLSTSKSLIAEFGKSLDQTDIGTISLGAQLKTPSSFRGAPEEAVPLNIIQHPVGQPKKIAIRNNLAPAAAAPELRYFTSTLGGSSRSPVLDDAWRAVGIHRGSIGTKVLSFPGRTTAVVNLGTQMSAILDSFPVHLHPEIQ